MCFAPKSQKRSCFFVRGKRADARARSRRAESGKAKLLPCAACLPPFQGLQKGLEKGPRVQSPGLGCGRPKTYDPQRGQHRKKSRSYWAARSVFSFALRNGQRLQGQLLAALRTTASQHLAAILRRHSLAEAMLLAALTLLGLISSQHLPHTSYYPKNLNGHRHRSNNQVSGLCRCLSVILRIRYIIVR